MSAQLLNFNTTKCMETDTLTLLIEARNYCSFKITLDTVRLDEVEKLSVSAASLLVTARLCSVMGWILEQKACAVGEALLGDGDLDTDWDYLLSQPRGTVTPLIPKGLQGLLDRSEQLVLRATRLQAAA